MPKMKTHSGSKKRFRFTATGKLKRAQQNKRHYLTGKTTKRKRHLRAPAYVHDAQLDTIAKMIGGQK